MIDNVIESYKRAGKNLVATENENIRDLALEEIVCNSLMSISSDEQAFQKAVKNTDESKLQKIAEALKKIISKVKSYFSNLKSNYAAKAFAEDINALTELAEIFSDAADYAKDNITVSEENTINYTEPDIKYSVKFEDIDPSTLDKDELKAYNNRGWSYGLFNKEDMVLLNEKFSQLNDSQHTDNVLKDGTRIVDINNKIVLIGGTFEDPQVHSVLVINASTEVDAELIKEYVYNERYYNRDDVYNCFQIIRSVSKQDEVRVYSRDDFEYYKGRSENWKRATIPDNFKSYGYTKQYEQRAGDSGQAQEGISAVQLRDKNISDIRYAIDEDFNGVFDDVFDMDLFEDEEKRIDLNKMIEENPETAIPLIYKASAKTAVQGLTAGKEIELEAKGLEKIVNKVMRDYHISKKLSTRGSNTSALLCSFRHIFASFRSFSLSLSVILGLPHFSLVRQSLFYIHLLFTNYLIYLLL